MCAQNVYIVFHVIGMNILFRLDFLTMQIFFILWL